MANRIQGKTKWFSNKKGYGFITPEEGSPFSEDIFVHQSSIHCDGYRTLDEGWEVEFEVGHDDDGKAKAINVTARGGGPCTGPRKSRRQGGGKRSSGSNRTNSNNRVGNNSSNRGGSHPQASSSFWHESLNDDVKHCLKDKDIRTTTGTIDVAIGDARVKLGTQGYASVAHAHGVIGEGTFVCAQDGTASFVWEHCIYYDLSAGEWVADADSGNKSVLMLPSSLSLSDANVIPVGINETAETLWGEGKPDPKEALEANGFLMRRVVLTPRRRH